MSLIFNNPTFSDEFKGFKFVVVVFDEKTGSGHPKKYDKKEYGIIDTII